MAVQTTNNKPINPRGNDQSPKGYNRASLFSGKALDFDGVNDTVNCGDFMTDNADFSVSFYLKINTWTNNKGVVSTWDNSYNGFAIALHSSGLRSWANDGANGGMVIVTQSELGTTEYHHIVLTYDYSTGTQKSYFNGHYTNQEVFVDTMTHSDFQIGYGNAAYTYSDVNVAGVKVFNEVLTAAQVADLYNNPEKIVPTGVADSALKLWLPMMEGAGTTAYDGSGNGNHGTISGATWTHGIGAPVSQTAVIDWNKGQNYVEHSEEIDDVYYNKSGVTITADNTISPDGNVTADRVNVTSDAQSGVRIFSQFDAEQYTMSFYAKAGTQTDIEFYVIQQGVAEYTIDIDLTNGTLSNVPAGISDSSITDAGNGWWRITATRTFTAAASNHGYGAVVSSGNGTNFYLWGFQHIQASSVGPYIPTFGTAQTSDVLLPQGLTSGRDITGVNLFENVRKQGALNLDGNSWAEVHDNASLDFGTGSFTLEAWARFKYVNQGSGGNIIICLGGGLTDSDSGGLSSQSSSDIYFWYRVQNSISATISEGDWVHVVGTYDETNTTLYINGSQADQDARTAGSVTNEHPIQIGRDTASNRFYNDQIAQPRIYNRALTAEEVQRNYDAGKNTYKN